jgi:hypothetical protein
LCHRRGCGQQRQERSLADSCREPRHRRSDCPGAAGALHLGGALHRTHRAKIVFGSGELELEPRLTGMTRRQPKAVEGPAASMPSRARPAHKSARRNFDQRDLTGPHRRSSSIPRKRVL